MTKLATSPISSLLLPEIEELVQQRDFGTLREVLDELSPPDVAELIQATEPEHFAVIFRLLSRQLAADVFEYLPLDEQEDLLHTLAHTQVAEILNEMDPDDRTALLEELPGEVTQKLIAVLSPQERQVATWLLKYPDESIGRLMTPDYVAVRSDWTVGEVFGHLRKHGREKETINVIYVVDARSRLLDDLTLRELVLADPETRVSELMDAHFVSLVATDDQEGAILVFEKYDRSSLPVVDHEGTLLGIVTFDDIMDVAKEEVTEDIQRIGGMEALETAYPLAGFKEMFQKRSGWLMLLFVGQFVTVWVLERFSGTLQAVGALAFFMPLIMSSGGNSGSQAASLVVRSLALEEIKLSDWWRVLRRELLQGACLGLLLGVMGVLRVVIWQYMDWDHSGIESLKLSIVVGGSLVGVVTVGTVAGSMLPFLMRRLGFDPAASSTPFIATLTDVAGVTIYFAFATIVIISAMATSQ